MSHFTSIATEIRDWTALQSACAELGLSFSRNSEARGYSGRTIKADAVIGLKGPYDIAVQQKQNGACELTCDWWGGHVEREVGKNYGRLLQLYGVHKAAREARRKGYTVRRKALNDGSIKLVIGMAA